MALGGGNHLAPVAMDERGIAQHRRVLAEQRFGLDGTPDVGALPDRAVVADVVYVPLETDLLAAARTRGLRIADGLGMLLHQAVGGFSLWFGVRPAVTPELRALVAADLAKT